MDGGSTDDTVSLLKKYSHLIWESKRDKSQSDAMNKAFEQSKGDIIMYLNADDEVAEADIFSLIVEKFSNHPNTDMVIGNLKVINADGSHFVAKPTQNVAEIIFSPNSTFPLNPVSYYYKRSVQERIGDFPLDNHFSMDFWFLLRVYWGYNLLFVDKVFGSFYFHENNKTSDLARAIASVANDRKEFWAETVQQLSNKNEPIEQRHLITNLHKIGGVINQKEEKIQSLNIKIKRYDDLIKGYGDKIKRYDDERQRFKNPIFLFKYISKKVFKKILNRFTGKR